MSKNIGEVRIVVSMMGEVCGKVTAETDHSITLESPRLFVPGNDAKGGGFAPGISMTGATELKEATFNKSTVLTIVPAHEGIAKGWAEMISGIILP